MQSTDPVKQLEYIKTGARVLFKPKQLVEVRARMNAGYWKGFYFTNHDYMAEIVQKLDQDTRIQSVYYVFNQINPNLIEQRKSCKCDTCVRGGLIVANPDANQIEKIIIGASQHLTTNEDIEWLNWLFIDVDTIRAQGFEHEPSSKLEKAQSMKVAQKIIDYLQDENHWPKVLMANSGNGYHILPKINLPNTSTNVDLVLDCLRSLDKKFSTEEAEIDNSVFNPARLTRAYGTHTRKGKDTKERPWRLNYLLPFEGSLGVVDFNQILTLGSTSPKASKAPRGDMPELDRRFDLDKFFAWYEDQGAFNVEEGHETWQGREVKVIDKCAISGYKHTGSVKTGFIVGDTLGYHCWSPECGNPSIGDVLHSLYEKGYKPYPHPIWKEEDVLDFNKDTSALESAMEEDEKLFERKPPIVDDEDEVIEDTVPGDVTLFDEVTIKKTVEEKGEAPSLPPANLKKERVRLVSKEPNDLAVGLMGIIFRDPEKAYPDFAMYRHRLEKISPYLKFPVGESLACLLLFEIDIRRLPSKEELIDYVTNHPTCKNHKNKEKICLFIRSIEDDPSRTFDVTVQSLIEEVTWKLEKSALNEAYKLLDQERDVLGFRTAMRKHWAMGITQDSNFQPGSWQESVEDIRESFRKDVEGVGNDRKFKLGFPSIDESGMNIGLDGEHAIVVCGPASSRKTTAVLTFAYNFAKEGKHGLFFAGEHQSMKVKKRLTLMFAQDMRDEVGIIPSLNKWEGNGATANWDDFENLDKVLNELQLMRRIPGWLEPQNVNAVARGEEDRLGAILAYAEATFKKYQWDFIVIDPLDTIMPPTSDGQGNWKACSEIVDRLFEFSRDAFGGKGCMVVTTAQFNSTTRREIEKIQEKNTGPDNYDDEIASLLRKDSSIQYFTTIGQRFDLCIGIAARVKNGLEGMLVQGRSREGGLFDVVDFKIDEHSNMMMEKDGGVFHNVSVDTIQNEDVYTPL